MIYRSIRVPLWSEGYPLFVSCTRTPCFYNYITIKRQERMTASERLAPKLATAKRVGRRGRDGVQGGGGKGVHDYNRYLWRPVLVKIMTIKLHHKSILIQLQQILWTCCVFLSSLNNTFFSVLIIIFSNKSYFCFNYTKCFFSFMP